MSVFRSRPALRWLVPSAAAVVVIGGGAAAGTIVASADPSLPERSAAQLLVDVQNAKVDGLSGTVVQSADLGLPAIAGVTGGQVDADLTRLIAGSNTARVWYAGEDKVRLALMGTLGETDVIRNGPDVWMWSSRSAEASHFKIPADAEKKPTALPSGVPSTPQEAADAALAAIDPTTVVTTTGAAEVAGRNAYELVLSPRDTTSLIGQVRLAIDAEKHIPLRVDVYAKNSNSPAVRVAFQQISFATPDAQQFVFNPPPGTKVNETNANQLEKDLAKEHKAEAHKAEAQKAEAAGEGLRTIGDGWTTIVTAKMPKGEGTEAPAGKEAQAVTGVLESLPKVSGTWGSGRLLAGSLFSVLVIDDGRVFAGAVTPEALYEAAAKK
ncbi:MAG: sigma-E factor regulatory protein RseB domain-containing protein [Actinoplanes sp.]